MKKAIYVFSGTGNTLTVARDLAAQTGAELIPIPSLLHEKTVAISADHVGIVFPIYEGAVPGLVRDFLSRVESLTGKYVYGVATFKCASGCVHKVLKRLIRRRGGRLSAGFLVFMPNNHIPAYKNYVSTAEQNAELFRTWREERLPEIAEYVSAQQNEYFQHEPYDDDPVGNFFISIPFFNRVLLRLNKKRDSNFYVTETCNACGICAKVCPVNNIVIEDGKPAFKHHCEQCFACLQWCPQEAMQYEIHFPFYKQGEPFGNRTEPRPRYHYPEVKAIDIIRQKG